MDEKSLLEAVSDHVGLMASLQWWMLATAVAAIYMVVASKDELDLKHVKVSKEEAGALLGAFYLTATAAFFAALLRLHGLIELLPEAQVPAAFTRMATAPWVFNPFAYFGGTPFYRLVALASLLALIAAWWFSFVSLSLLRGKYARAEVIFAIAFNALGLLALAAIQQVYFLLASRTAAVNPELSATLTSLKESRLSLLGWGNFLGGVVSFAAIYLISKRESWKTIPPAAAGG